MVARMKLPTMAVAAGIATLAVAVPFAEGANKTVVVDNFRYSPSTVSVKRGDTVTWRFRRDAAPHNVRGSGGIRSRSRITTGTYRKRFRRRGTFRYICSLHPNMKGTVRVR
jgi:plastocyanin